MKKKYLSYIIGYAIYASIVLIGIADEHGHYFWEPFLGWLITFPLILGSVTYFGYRYYRRHYCDDGIEEVEDSTKSLFIENWSLIDFAREYGPRMQVGKFTNKDTGKSYQACVFIQRDGTQTYVNFFSELGELTPDEISKRKNELKVGFTASNKLYLHDEDVNMWEDVKLGL